MPRAEVTFVWRHSSASSLYGRFWPEVRNDNVIPGVAILVTQNNKVIRHRIVGIRRLQPIAQLGRFTESGLGEVDMINVGAFAGAGGSGALFTRPRCFLRCYEWQG